MLVILFNGMPDMMSWQSFESLAPRKYFIRLYDFTPLLFTFEIIFSMGKYLNNQVEDLSTKKEQTKKI